MEFTGDVSGKFVTFCVQSGVAGLTRQLRRITAIRKGGETLPASSRGAKATAMGSRKNRDRSYRLRDQIFFGIHYSKELKMRQIYLTILAVGMVISVFPMSGPAVAAPSVAVSRTPLPTDKDKLKVLIEKLQKIRKEVATLEKKIREERAAGNPLKARRSARKLRLMQRDLGRIESRIRALTSKNKAKAEESSQRKAKNESRTSCKCKQEAATGKALSRQHQKRILASRKLKSKKRMTEARKVIQRRIQTLGKSTGDSTRKLAARRSPPRKAIAGSGLAAEARKFMAAVKKIRSRLGRLLKDKTALEQKLRKTHGEIGKAQRTLAAMKRAHARKIRKFQMAARRRMESGKRAAAIRARMARRAPRPPRLPARSRTRTAPDHGADASKELKMLRIEVMKIRKLLESVLKERQKADQPKSKKRKGKRKDYRTL